jgi:flagellar biosynthetic protein FlhB
MAENDTPQHDRTEQPSAKRLEDARARGEVPRSRELAMTAVVICGAGVLLGGRDYFAAGLAGLFEGRLDLPRSTLFDAELMPQALLEALGDGFALFLPLAVATMVAAVGGSLALGGWSFSAAGLTPNFARMNPVNGLKRIVSSHGLVELLKALAKFAVVAAVAGLLLWRFGGDFLELGALTAGAAIGRSAWLAGICLAGLAASLVLVAAADVPFQFWHHRRQLRMTKQEAKDEQKETEGRPEVRSRIRALQRAIANRRMLADVPKADVVAMNPSHYAVALRYDAATMKAPRVVAKGADLMAFRIRQVAEAHGVPIFEHPQFARALYFTSDLGKDISPRLYVAVAQVLTYIYQLTGRPTPGGKRRAKPSKVRPTARDGGSAGIAGRKSRPTARDGGSAGIAGRKSRPQRPELDIDPELAEPQRGRVRFSGVSA